MKEEVRVNLVNRNKKKKKDVCDVSENKIVIYTFFIRSKTKVFYSYIHQRKSVSNWIVIILSCVKYMKIFLLRSLTHTHLLFLPFEQYDYSCVLIIIHSRRWFSIPEAIGIWLIIHFSYWSECLLTPFFSRVNNWQVIVSTWPELNGVRTSTWKWQLVNKRD
jgi:hypothetical protein